MAVNLDRALDPDNVSTNYCAVCADSLSAHLEVDWYRTLGTGATDQCLYLRNRADVVSPQSIEVIPAAVPDPPPKQ